MIYAYIVCAILMAIIVSRAIEPTSGGAWLFVLMAGALWPVSLAWMALDELWG